MFIWYSLGLMRSSDDNVSTSGTARDAASHYLIVSRDDFLALGRDEKAKLGDASFKGRELLDGFVGSNPFGFSSEEMEVVRSWEHRVKGTFLVVKVTKEARRLSGCAPDVDCGVASWHLCWQLIPAGNPAKG